MQLRVSARTAKGLAAININGIEPGMEGMGALSGECIESCFWMLMRTTGGTIIDQTLKSDWDNNKISRLKRTLAPYYI